MTGEIGGLAELHRAVPHMVDGDEPETLLGTDQGISPVELLLTAVTHCVGTTLSYHAALKGVELKDVQIDARGEIDLRGFLGTDDEVHARLSQVELDFTIDADATEAELQQLVELAVKRSPVSDTVKHGTRVTPVASLAEPGTHSWPAPKQDTERTSFGTERIDGLDIFFREAGDPAHQTILLLHGFPTSSHMFRNLIPMLAKHYHVIAPDYPGFGLSSMPPRSEFEYTFDNMAAVMESFLKAKGIDEFALYVMDYGAPIGFRLFEADPSRVTALLVQNGNAYEEGLSDFWNPLRAYWASGSHDDRDVLRGVFEPDMIKQQYLDGVRDPSAIDPANWLMDQPLLDRPGSIENQLDLFFDYRNNLDRYPVWQGLLRNHQPPTLITWGANDIIFPAAGAHAYLRDLPDAELRLLDTGHFALEEEGALVAELISEFMQRSVVRKGNAVS